MARLDTFQQNLQKTQREEGEKLINSLQLDSQRITDVELRVRKVEILSNKIYAIDQSVKQTVLSLDDVRATLYYCERIVPLLIHVQLSEGLRNFAVTANLQSNLIDFDREKIDQLMSYIKNTQKQPPSISTLSKRLEAFGTYLVKQGMGSAPFNFGTNQDYPANMTNPETPFNKSHFFEIRAELFKNMQKEQQ